MARTQGQGGWAVASELNARVCEQPGFFSSESQTVPLGAVWGPPAARAQGRDLPFGGGGGGERSFSSWRPWLLSLGLGPGVSATTELSLLSFLHLPPLLPK